MGWDGACGAARAGAVDGPGSDAGGAGGDDAEGGAAISSAGRDGSVTGSSGARDARGGSCDAATMPEAGAVGRSALMPAKATVPSTMTPTATAAIAPRAGPARRDERTVTPSSVMAPVFGG